MASLLDRCMFVPTAGGTADFTISTAVTGYMTPAQAGAVNTTTYYYGAESSSKTEWEVGLGTYSTSGPTLARTTVLFSSNANAKVNFSAAPNVFITLLAENKTSSSDFGLAKVDGSTITATNGIISSLTKIRYGAAYLHSATTITYSAGFAVGVLEIVPNGGTIDRIGFLADSASATTNWRVGVYSDSAYTMNSRLQQSNLVSGVVQGINITNLTSPYTNSSGSDQFVWLTMVTDTANFTMHGNALSVTVRLWNNSGSTLPSTASAQSNNAAGWVIFGYGSAGA